ncbi:MAG TPA: hypothetical protein VMV72_06990 [Verrucomicrobiae bacterium]|nr:hypothetical protein [Verrucomicrobiae bacterium]
MSRPIAIFAGYLARYPLGGHLLSQYHFLAGLAKLGYDVAFLEHHGWSNACYDPRTNTMTDDPSYGLSQILPFFDRIGLHRWCYVDAADKWHGLQRDEVRALCRDAAFVMSSASTTWLDELRECPTRIFIDIDPGFTQFRMPPTPTPSCPGYASPYDFNFHFTFGERIGKPDCPIPTRGLRWHPCRQPLALDLISPRFTPEAKRFTTVMSWTAYGSAEYEGVSYGQKNVELLKFIDLPRRAGEVFEIALGGANAPAQMLRDNGWTTVEALAATLIVGAYLDYIGQSRGEFSVAKEAYVKTRCGWFSDRTAAYLASGKPVIVQDTGFADALPCGEGLFAFQTADDVINAIEHIHGDYARHCHAARQLAGEHFDSDRVLGRILQTCGVPVPRRSPGAN